MQRSRDTGRPSVGRYATEDLFDTARYPLNERGSPNYQAVVEQARSGLEAERCARLEGFVRQDILVLMQEEAESLAPRATYTEKDLNPYFSDPPPDCPPDHPLRRFSPRRHGMVRGDMFDRDGAIWAVFQNTDLCRFVGDCLRLEQLYTYRDPYGCVNVNVQPRGREFAWHFDHNDFTVSMGLKQPAQGGVFEYVPDIRTRTEENYDDVQRVLDGDRSRVRVLALRPGDLQLFRGGYNLHRVTAAESGERHSLLLSYVTDPHHIATPDYALRLWGDVHPDQRDAAARTHGVR